MFQVATAPATMLHSADATPSYPQLRIEVNPPVWISLRFWPFTWIPSDNSSPSPATKKEMCQDSHFPCLHCHPQSYIRMVQHLIERCLILRMGRDDCVEALAQHANIEPLVTLTVWKELLKENTEFFQDYFRDSSPRQGTS